MVRISTPCYKDQWLKCLSHAAMFKTIAFVAVLCLAALATVDALQGKCCLREFSLLSDPPICYPRCKKDIHSRTKCTSNIARGLCPNNNDNCFYCTTPDALQNCATTCGERAIEMGNKFGNHGTWFDMKDKRCYSQCDCDDDNSCCPNLAPDDTAPSFTRLASGFCMDELRVEIHNAGRATDSTPAYIYMSRTDTADNDIWNDQAWRSELQTKCMNSPNCMAYEILVNKGETVNTPEEIRLYGNGLSMLLDTDGVLIDSTTNKADMSKRGTSDSKDRWKFKSSLDRMSGLHGIANVPNGRYYFQSGTNNLVSSCSSAGNNPDCTPANELPISRATSVSKSECWIKGNTRAFHNNNVACAPQTRSDAGTPLHNFDFAARQRLQEDVGACAKKLQLSTRILLRKKKNRKIEDICQDDHSSEHDPEHNVWRYCKPNNGRDKIDPNGRHLHNTRYYTQKNNQDYCWLEGGRCHDHKDFGQWMPNIIIIGFKAGKVHRTLYHEVRARDNEYTRPDPIVRVCYHECSTDDGSEKEMVAFLADSCINKDARGKAYCDACETYAPKKDNNRLGTSRWRACPHDIVLMEHPNAFKDPSNALASEDNIIIGTPVQNDGVPVYIHSVHLVPRPYILYEGKETLNWGSDSLAYYTRLQHANYMPLYNKKWSGTPFGPWQTWNLQPGKGVRKSPVQDDGRFEFDFNDKSDVSLKKNFAGAQNGVWNVPLLFDFPDETTYNKNDLATGNAKDIIEFMAENNIKNNKEYFSMPRLKYGNTGDTYNANLYDAKLHDILNYQGDWMLDGYAGVEEWEGTITFCRSTCIGNNGDQGAFEVDLLQRKISPTPMLVKSFASGAKEQWQQHEMDARHQETLTMNELMTNVVANTHTQPHMMTPYLWALPSYPNPLKFPPFQSMVFPNTKTQSSAYQNNELDAMPAEHARSSQKRQIYSQPNSDINFMGTYNQLPLQTAIYKMGSANENLGQSRNRVQMKQSTTDFPRVAVHPRNLVYMNKDSMCRPFYKMVYTPADKSYACKPCAVNADTAEQCHMRIHVDECSDGDKSENNCNPLSGFDVGASLPSEHMYVDAQAGSLYSDPAQTDPKKWNKQRKLDANSDCMGEYRRIVSTSLDPSGFAPATLRPLAKITRREGESPDALDSATKCSQYCDSDPECNMFQLVRRLTDRSHYTMPPSDPNVDKSKLLSVKLVTFEKDGQTEELKYFQASPTATNPNRHTWLCYPVANCNIFGTNKVLYTETINEYEIKLKNSGDVVDLNFFYSKITVNGVEYDMTTPWNLPANQLNDDVEPYCQLFHSADTKRVFDHKMIPQSVRDISRNYKLMLSSVYAKDNTCSVGSATYTPIQHECFAAKNVEELFSPPNALDGYVRVADPEDLANGDKLEYAITEDGLLPADKQTTQTSYAEAKTFPQTWFRQCLTDGCTDSNNVMLSYNVLCAMQCTHNYNHNEYNRAAAGRQNKQCIYFSVGTSKETITFKDHQGTTSTRDKQVRTCTLYTKKPSPAPPQTSPKCTLQCQNGGKCVLTRAVKDCNDDSVERTIQKCVCPVSQSNDGTSCYHGNVCQNKKLCAAGTLSCNQDEPDSNVCSKNALPAIKDLCYNTNQPLFVDMYIRESHSSTTTTLTTRPTTVTATTSTQTTQTTRTTTTTITTRPPTTTTQTVCSARHAVVVSIFLTGGITSTREAPLRLEACCYEGAAPYVKKQGPCRFGGQINWDFMQRHNYVHDGHDYVQIMFLDYFALNVEDFNSPFVFVNRDSSGHDQRYNNIRSLEGAFMGTTKFNQDLSGWSLAIVTNMNFMFQDALAFNNKIDASSLAKSLSSSFVSVRKMFSQSYIDVDPAWKFEYLISAFRILEYKELFKDESKIVKFNQPLSSWQVSKVTDMQGMFQLNTRFNQDIDSWDTQRVTSMSYMFRDTTFNQDINSWQTSNVKDMYGMFAGNRGFDQDLSKWDVSQVTDARFMFCDTTLQTPAFAAWDFANFDLDIEGLYTNNFFYADFYYVRTNSLCLYRDNFPAIFASKLPATCTTKATTPTTTTTPTPTTQTKQTTAKPDVTTTTTKPKTTAAPDDGGGGGGGGGGLTAAAAAASTGSDSGGGGSSSSSTPTGVIVGGIVGILGLGIIITVVAVSMGAIANPLRFFKSSNSGGTGFAGAEPESASLL